jgi:hypothetical protein
MPTSELASLHIILVSLQDPVSRWAQQIGFIIPRDPHFESVGDASGLAGGIYCDVLMFWFDITLSDRVYKSMATPANHKAYVHTNSMEYCHDDPAGNCYHAARDDHRRAATRFPYRLSLGSRRSSTVHLFLHALSVAVSGVNRL